MSTTTPINPPPATTTGRGELPAYVSNGVVGLRVRDIPLRSGMAIVSGLSGEHPVMRVEAAARAPYPLAGDLQLGRVWLSDAPQFARLVHQDYDFSCGELHTAFIFEVKECRARVEVTTFCSRSHPTLVLQEVEVTLDQACDIALRSVVDPEGVHGRWLRRSIGTPGHTVPFTRLHPRVHPFSVSRSGMTTTTTTDTSCGTWRSSRFPLWSSYSRLPPAPCWSIDSRVATPRAEMRNCTAVAVCSFHGKAA